MSDTDSSNDSNDFMDSPFFQRASQARSRQQGTRLTVGDLINERFDRSSGVSPDDLPSVVEEGTEETEQKDDPDSSGESPLGGTLDVSV